MTVVLIGYRPLLPYIENTLKKIGFPVTINYKFIDDEGWVANTQYNNIGFKSESYVVEVRDYLKTPPSSDIFIVTKHPIESGKRFNKVTNGKSNTLLLTLKNLESSSYNAHQTLIYYGLVQFQELDAFSIETHDSICISNSFQGPRILSKPNLCSQCRILDDDTFEFQSKKLNQIYEKAGKYYQNHHVLITHGIRSTGVSWVGSLMNTLNVSGFSTSVSGYPRFSTIRLILYFLRLVRIDVASAAKQEFLAEYQRIRNRYPASKISVIAHSHGTLILRDILISNNSINFENIILAGSIINRDFDWAVLQERRQVIRLLNDCGSKDIFPAIAENWIYSAGASGSTGFTNEDNDTRASLFTHDFSHSDMLNDKLHHKKVWIPYLEGSEISELSDLTLLERNSSQRKRPDDILTFSQKRYVLPTISALLYILYILYQYFV